MRGFKGNEGKTWFQAYLESRYGYERVVRMDLKARQQDLLYALSRRPLCAADIFLFNVPRASEENDFCSYSTLEAIKDGTGTSTKYHTTPIRFRTPSVVMVFPTQHPYPTRCREIAGAFTTSKEINLFPSPSPNGPPKMARRNLKGITGNEL